MADRPPTSDTAAGLEPVTSTAPTTVALEPITDPTPEVVIDTGQTAVGLEVVPPSSQTAVVLEPVVTPRANYLKWGPLGAVLAILVLGLGLYLLDSSGGATGADLMLSSTPDGATVKVDGRTLAHRTPVALTGLSPERPHVVVVELLGYQAWTRHLKLGPDTPKTLHAVLQPEQP